jgi:hypothetical protein
VNGKCPYCDADFHGHVGGKHAVKPHDVVRNFKCGHDIYLYLPCLKCERSDEDCEVYRRSLLVKLQQVYIYCHGMSRSAAWARAKEMMDW